MAIAGVIIDSGNLVLALFVELIIDHDYLQVN